MTPWKSSKTTPTVPADAVAAKKAKTVNALAVVGATKMMPIGHVAAVKEMAIEAAKDMADAAPAARSGHTCATST